MADLRRTIFEERELWELTEDLIKPAITALNQSPKKNDAVDRILSRFQARLHRSVLSIRAIRERHDEKCMADIGAIVRTMYDACLQGMHLANGPRHFQLAEDFEDFSFLERHKLIERLNRNVGLRFVDTVLASPDRAKAEPEMSVRIARAKAKFRTGGKKENYHQNWYSSDLRGLAAKFGLELEYDFIITILHGPVHTTPLMLLSPTPPVVPALADMCSWFLYMRMVRAALAYHEIAPPTEELRQQLSNAQISIPNRWEQLSKP